jgi:hypothetical protein
MAGTGDPVTIETFRFAPRRNSRLALSPVLARELARDLPQEYDAIVLVLVQRCWSFMLEQPHIYRLMNGMDGVMIDREKVGSTATGSFGG